MAVISKDLGAVTAYAAAVNRGYTGTKEEFETLMASYATVAQQAAESAGNASQSATDASQSATDAETAKGTAQQAATDAQNAQASAQESAQSAQQSAQSASQSATDAESAKDTAVNAVDGFAAGAQQALDSVNQAGNNWKSLAQAQKLDAEAWATGKRDGEDVGSSDPAYHNNAKYYAESVSASAQTATEAAQTATQKASDAQASASAAAESARTLTIDATLTQSGQAADAKATGDVRNDLNYVFPKTTTTYIPKGGNHEGTELLDFAGYVGTDGVYHSSANYSSSDYIEIPAYAVIDMSAAGIPTICTVSFYDSDKAFISGISAETNWGAIRGIQPIPDNAKYFRLTFMNANSGGFATVTIATILSQVELKQAVETINTKIENTSLVNVADIVGQSGFVDANGVFQSTSAWVVTDYIPCKAISSVTDYARLYNGTPYAVFYDKYKMFISAALGETEGLQTIELEIPSDAYYFRLNYFKANTTQYYSITTDLRKASAININNAFDPLYGKKIGAVGDSITIGTYSAPNMTYVNQIANAHDMTVDNQAIWGSVFPTGKSDGSGNAKGSIYAQLANVSSDCDMLVISGGINDADYQADDSYWGAVSGGYTATLDTTTFCGAFEATLRDALDIFKGKPILFVFEHRMTMKYGSEYGTHFEDVQYALMIEMLKKWGIPYVDLFHDMPSIKFTDGYIALYSFDDKGVHPNATGYRKFYVPRVESKLIDLVK